MKKITTCLSFLATLALVSPAPAQAPMKVTQACPMKPQEMNEKIQALRKSVGCELYQYNPLKCSQILGLYAGGAVAAAGGIGATIASKIRNPGAPLCTVQTIKSDAADVLALLFTAEPAEALPNSCPSELRFLKQGIDQATSDHVRDIGQRIQAQNAEIAKQDTHIGETRAQLLKTLGLDPKSSISDADLSQKVDVELHRKAPGVDPMTEQRNTARRQLRKQLFELRAKADDLMGMRHDLDAPENLAETIKENNAAIKQAAEKYHGAFSSSNEEAMFKNKVFTDTANAELENVNAKIKDGASGEALEDLEHRASYLKSRLEQYAGETKALRAGPNGERFFQSFYQATAAEGRKQTLEDLSLHYNQSQSVRNRMKVALTKMNDARFKWNGGKFGFGKPSGSADLEDMREALIRMRGEGKDITSLAGRFQAADLRAAAATLQQRGVRIERSIFIRGLSALGTGLSDGALVVVKAAAPIAGAMVSGAAFAADFIIPTDGTACDATRPRYLAFKSDCSLDYSINSSNADALFSDTLSNAYAKEDGNYSCFIQKNWQQRFGKWSVACQPTAPGQFKSKIYATRADGTQFYFERSSDPKIIGASISNQAYTAVALEMATCCTDANPRITDRECANYGVRAAPNAASGKSPSSHTVESRQ